MQGGGGGAVDVMAAPSWAFKKFQENIGQWLLLSVVALLVPGVIGFIVSLIAGFISSGRVVAVILSAVVSLVVTVVSALTTRGLIRGALRTTRGESPDLQRDLLDMEGISPYVVLVLILAGISFVLSLFQIIPILGFIIATLGSIVVAFLTAFAYVIQLDRGGEPIESIKSSVELVQSQPGPAIGGIFLYGIIIFVGVLACCIGVFFTFPIGVLSLVHLYKQLRGEPIAP